jgi:endonuclease/exonuclease/phosphatase family metal-dependent hydrolase
MNKLELVTWNILADHYIRPEFYPHTPSSYLNPATRHPMLLAAISAQDADLYCLQEVEQTMFDTILEVMQPLGWQGQLAVKDGHREGVALLWRTRAVEVSATHTLHYAATSKGHRSTALIAHIRPVSGARPFVLVSTHLAWAHHSTPATEHPGVLQLAELLDVRDAGQLMPAGLPWIICGDLNDEYTGPVLTLARDRGLTVPCTQMRPWHTGNFNERPVKLDYTLCDPGAPTITPHPLPRLEKTTPMPGPDHASDHLPLCVALSWPDLA